MLQLLKEKAKSRLVKRNKMTQKISEDTNVTLDLKTIGLIVGGVVSLTSMYFVLKSDIALAMEKPEPEVSKIEWSYKDELVRSEISNTNEKVLGLEKSVEEIKEQLNKIDERLYEYMKSANRDEMCNNCFFPDMCQFCSN